MKDTLERKDSRLKVQTVLGAVKERLVEYRFNIDIYDLKDGALTGRRNTLDKIVLGLYRNVSVLVKKTDGGHTGDLSITLEWGGLLLSNILTFAFTFLVAYAILKGEGLIAFAYSIPVGFLFVILNLGLFILMRVRIRKRIKEDLRDLEKEEKRRGRSTR
jgi:hypothetical protein